MIFKRRDFLKTSFGALFAASMPTIILAEAAKGEQMPDGLSVQMSVIASGPFLSFRHKFKLPFDPTISEYVNYATVKISDRVYDFDQCGHTQDLYNAEEFMRRLGYKVWLCTDEVKNFKRPENDKKYRSNAFKFV